MLNYPKEEACQAARRLGCMEHFSARKSTLQLQNLNSTFGVFSARHYCHCIDRDSSSSMLAEHEELTGIVKMCTTHSRHVFHLQAFTCTLIGDRH